MLAETMLAELRIRAARVCWCKWHSDTWQAVWYLWHVCQITANLLRFSITNINYTGCNSRVHRETCGKFESSNLSRDNLSREISRTRLSRLRPKPASRRLGGRVDVGPVPREGDLAERCICKASPRTCLLLTWEDVHM